LHKLLGESSDCFALHPVDFSMVQRLNGSIFAGAHAGHGVLHILKSCPGKFISTYCYLCYQPRNLPNTVRGPVPLIFPGFMDFIVVCIASFGLGFDLRYQA